MSVEPILNRVSRRIARKKGNVFLRKDFEDLGDYDQVGRALRMLVRNGRLVKIGYGLYTRAAPSPFDGKPTPVKGIRTLTTEALMRLNVKTVESAAEREYNQGTSTQVPTGRVVGVTKRVRRKIGYGGRYVIFENVGSAKL